MAEDIKDINDSQTGNEGQASKDPTRSESRQKDLADKLAEQDRLHALEIEEERKKRKEAEDMAKDAVFKSEFFQQSQKYPHAQEHKDEIKSYTEKGLSVEEATMVVLGKNNKLTTGEQMKKEGIDVSSFGGSTVNASPTGEKSPDNMTQEERRQAIIDNFEVNDSGFFLKK